MSSFIQPLGVIFTFIFFILFLRLIHSVRSTHLRNRQTCLERASLSDGSGKHSRCRLTVLLGSGGHTGEMIRLLSGLPFDRYTPRTYVISSADSLSKTKAIELEQFKKTGQYTFLEIPRARKVNQSFATSILTTVHSLLCCVWAISVKSLCAQSLASSSLTPNNQTLPDLTLLNGPGSAVPIALSVFLVRLLTGKSASRLIYVESLARVKRLSLTGILLLPFMDCFIVQWEQLLNTINGSKLYQFLHKLNLVPVITFDGWMV